MSRRSMIGVGLVALGAGFYMTGPTDRGGDKLPAPALPLAMTTAAPPAQMRPQGPAAKEPAKAVATAPAAMAPPPPATPPPQPQAAAAAPPAAPEARPDGPTAPVNTAPRLINGPNAGPPKAAARSIPVDGPRNGDLPPATSTGKAATAPVVENKATPQPSPPLAGEAPRGEAVATQKAPTRPDKSPRREPAKPDLTGVIIAADAQPAPRANPPPRVQW